MISVIDLFWQSGQWGTVNSLTFSVTSTVTATYNQQVGKTFSIASGPAGTIGTPDIKFFGASGNNTAVTGTLLGGAATVGDILVVNTGGGADGGGLGTVVMTDDVSGSTGWIKISDALGDATTNQFRTTKWWKRCVGGETTVTMTLPSNSNMGFEAVICRSLGTTCEAYVIGEGLATSVAGDRVFQTSGVSGNGQVYIGCTTESRNAYSFASIDNPPATHDNNGVGGNGQSVTSGINIIMHINDQASLHTTADLLSYRSRPDNPVYDAFIGIRPFAGSPGVVTTATFAQRVGLSRPVSTITSATLTKQVGLPRPTTTVTSATFTKQVGLVRPVTTTVTATALIQKVILILAAVSSAVTATFTKQVGLPRSTTTTTTTTFTKQVGLPRSVISNVTATFAQRVGKLCSAVSNTTTTFLKNVGLVRPTSSVTTATLTKQVGLPRPVTTTTTTTFTKRVGLIRSATSVVTSSYNFVAMLNEFVTSTVTATYFRVAGTVFTLTFTATSVVTATYNQQVGKAINVVVNVTPSFAKVVALHFAITTVVTASYLRTFPSTAVARLRLLMGWGT